jgi:hypothetical protein
MTCTCSARSRRVSRDGTWSISFHLISISFYTHWHSAPRCYLASILHIKLWHPLFLCVILERSVAATRVQVAVRLVPDHALFSISFTPVKVSDRSWDPARLTVSSKVCVWISFSFFLMVSSPLLNSRMPGMWADWIGIHFGVLGE